MDIRPLTTTEQKYTYAQSMQLEGQTGTIGHRHLGATAFRLSKTVP